MAGESLTDFPLFPLPVVLLPSEVVPLHIFEERYKTMIEECLDDGSEFGIVWLSDDGLKDIGCTARVAEVLERMDDGRMNILVRGTSPFRLVSRQEDQVYPAGTIELLDDGPTEDEEDDEAAGAARSGYADLVEQITEERPEEAALAELNSYEMAASVDIELPVKQGLLELRTEAERLQLLARLFREGIKRLQVAENISERAQGNGKVSIDE
jgi:Lon protease-like protein